ncbi:hypothetical protein DMENIID0001_070800 [Sergentomyia squamirostris]
MVSEIHDGSAHVAQRLIVNERINRGPAHQQDRFRPHVQCSTEDHLRQLSSSQQKRRPATRVQCLIEDKLRPAGYWVELLVKMFSLKRLEHYCILL